MRAFADFTELSRFGTTYNNGVAWGDCDGDGDLDLAVLRTAYQSRLYRNEGGDSFVELDLFTYFNDISAGCWGDYDNDGDLDLALACYGTPSRVLKNTGGNVFTEIVFTPSGFHQSTAVAWGDYDNDGDLDLAIANHDTCNILYRNDGGDVFTDVLHFGSGDPLCLAWGDYDNDGDLDLAEGNYGTGNRLYRNEGNSTFTELAQFGNGKTRGMSWGDSDNDGDLDLAVVNGEDRQNELYRNDGGGGFTRLLRFGLGNSYGVAWGDYDNDGDLDLAVSNGDFVFNQNRLFRNEGGNSFSLAEYLGEGDSRGIAWGDCDDDGDIDLAVANRDTNKLYKNNEDSRDYVKVICLGLGGIGYTNRSAVGTRVRAYDAGTLNLRGLREIETTSGFASMNSLEAHFGLPAGDTFDIEVSWPASGRICLVEGVVAPAVLKITEDCVVTGINPLSGEPQASTLMLLQNEPNPFGVSTRILYQIPARGHVTLFIYDVAGRLVRTLVHETQDAGIHTVCWDGKDSQGRRTATGVYVCRLESAAYAKTMGMIFIR